MITRYSLPFFVSQNQTLYLLVVVGFAVGGGSLGQAMANGTPLARKVMVIADPTRDSAAALQYALSHALIEQDELILLHVENANKWKNTFSGFLRLPSLSSFPWYNGGEGDRTRVSYMENQEVTTKSRGQSPLSLFSTSATPASSEGALGDVDFLEQMKRICETAQPKMRVRVERVEMESSKAATILLKSDVLGVDLIIIGQRRSFSSAILGSKRPGGSSRGIDTADYLIENSKCTCVGVQKKGQNKGYLLNTKSHKNFWLLA